MTLNTPEDLEHLRVIGRIVADVLQRMGDALEPGMRTSELDALGSQWLTEAGARSAPALSYGFPGATCISVNHEVAHGLPGARQLQAGDLVNIDVSAEKNGYFADTGASFCVPPAQPARAQLCQTGYAVLMRAIDEVRAGRPINGIGKRLQAEVKRRGLTLIENLGSHGVGRALHEAPEFIAPYFDRRDKRVLEAGMVITLEPFVSNGAKAVHELNDGWTLATRPGFDTVQYEHTLVVTTGKPLILTLRS
ncbi:MAG: type I methionyl aminopeptidase [Candidatus Sericytochromatia bacterium]